MMEGCARGPAISRVLMREPLKGARIGPLVSRKGSVAMMKRSLLLSPGERRVRC